MLLACCSWYLRKPPRQAFSLASSYLNKTTTSIVRDDDPMSKPPFCLITRRFLSAPSGKKVGHSISPWLMLSAEIELSSRADTPVFKFYSLEEDKVISIDRKNLKAQLGLESKEEVILECRGSSHGWLVLFARGSSELFLYNPLSNRHLKLPTIRKLETIREKDLEIGHCCVNKLIISSSDPEGDVNCRALMIHGRRDNLAYCCPNSSSSNEWFDTYLRYKDVACCAAGDNLFLGINDDKPTSGTQWHYPEFECWDLKDVLRPMLISLEDRLVKDFGKTFPWKGYGPKKEWMGREENFLVAAADDMYYVCLNSGNWELHQEGDYHFHVHKFDFESGKLVHMDRSLDGLAFFVGRNHSFALSAAEFPQVLEPNSIYFTHQEDYHDYPFGKEQVKAYNYQDGTFQTKNLCTFNDKMLGIDSIQLVWYTPTCAAAAA